MNVLNELVTRIRAEDAGSVSALVVSKKEDTRFGKTVSWAEKLETAFGWIAAITIFLSLTALIRSLIGCEKRASISTKEVTSSYRHGGWDNGLDCSSWGRKMTLKSSSLWKQMWKSSPTHREEKRDAPPQPLMKGNVSRLSKIRIRFSTSVRQQPS